MPSDGCPSRSGSTLPEPYLLLCQTPDHINQHTINRLPTHCATRRVIMHLQICSNFQSAAKLRAMLVATVCGKPLPIIVFTSVKQIDKCPAHDWTSACGYCGSNR